MSDRRQCTAIAKSTGQRCKRSPILGGAVCSKHGASAPQVKAAAARRVAEAKATAQLEKATITLGLKVDTTPTEALLDEVQWTAGHVAWLRAKVQELDSEGGSELTWGTIREKTATDGHETVEAAQPSVWYQLYLKEREHLVRVCAEALRAGIQERQVKLAEQQGALIATAIQHILDALHLTPQQVELVPQIVPQVLRQIGAP